MESFPALVLTVLVILSYANSIVIVRAGDPYPLQDMCVADLNSQVIVNGIPCKDAAMVTKYDFMLKGLDKAGDTSNMLGFNVTQASVMELPGLNNLGISMVWIDFATPPGLVPPHIHSRATEILVVIKGTLSVGFITTNNTLIATKLEKGDVFMFPKGLMHFQLNIGSVNAVAISGLTSQNLGTQVVANALFRASPSLDASIFSRAFQINAKLIHPLQNKFKSSF